MKYFHLSNGYGFKCWVGTDKCMIREASKNALEFIGVSIDYLMRKNKVDCIVLVKGEDCVAGY